MLPHMTPKGWAALGRLKCFDNAKKKMVVPDTLKVVRLKPRSRFCIHGDIQKKCGWTKGELIDSIEAKRVGRNHE